MAHRNYQDDIFTRKRYALDAAFHLKIAEMSKNKYLLKLLRQILEHIYFRHRTEGIPSKRLIESPKEHQEILQAIKVLQKSKEVYEF